MNRPEDLMIEPAPALPADPPRPIPASELAVRSLPAERPRRLHEPYLPSEGIKMSLLEEGMLEGAGVLLGGKPAVDSYGLSETSIELFLAVAGAMPEGLTRARVPKRLAKDLDEHLLELELQELVEWLRDGRGRQTRLVLSWKGQETFDAARPRKATSLAARRRAQVNHG